MTTIAVVGANGYIGRHVVACMTAQGIDVIALSSRDGSGLDPQTGLFPADFAFPRNVDGVIYAAQSPHYRNVPDAAWHLLAVNSVAPLQVAMAAEKAGAKNFIYLSTGNVYKPSFEPLSEADEIFSTHWYPFSKIQGEQALALLKNKLQITVVRVFAVYGPGQTDKLIPNLIDSVEMSRPVNLAPRHEDIPDGGLRINPCYIDDAVDVLASLACKGGPSILNLAGPQVVSIKEIAEMWAKLRKIIPVIAAAPIPRTMDLVADITLLQAYAEKSFQSLDQGLLQVAIQWANSK